MMPYLAYFLLALALVLFFQSRRYRKAAGLPGGRVIYTDTDEWGEVEAPLFDPIAKLTGRPDYIVRQGDKIIPVEVKSGRVPDSPYDSHIFQVAAYCMLVEREFGKRPPHGIIHYGKRTFAVDYTAELEDALLDLLTEMRRVERRKNVDRSHEMPPRCRGCGFAYTCEQAL
jgi:CRISPR-associated exonuclease Cas4